MAAQVKLDRNTLAAGEVSPMLYGQDDLARQRAGCKKLENKVVLVEGGATRRPGTRFADPLKSETQNGKIVDFRVRPTDSYKLLMNGGAMRVYRNGGMVLTDAGATYELPIPWVSADLSNLRWSRDLDTMYFACRGYRQRELIRHGHNSWTITEHANIGGPVKLPNTEETKTLIASGITGSVTLLAAGHTPFLPGHVGGVWKLEEPSLVDAALWKASETITVAETLQTGGSGYIGSMTAGGGLAAAFDTTTAQLAAASAQSPSAQNSGWVGRDYGSTPRKVQKIKFYGSSDQGFISGVDNTVTWSLYGKNGAAPASATDGVLLGHVTTPDGNGITFEINSNDTQTAWKYVWALGFDVNNRTWVCAELQVYSPSASATAAQRRYNGRVYQALNNGDAGTNPPDHEEGDALTSGGGIKWRFLHKGYGFVRIDAVIDSTHASCTVLSRLPDSTVEKPTYRWSASAWDGVEGWPERNVISDGRLWWIRGSDYWASRPRDFTNHEEDDTDESAISGSLLSPSGEMVEIEWALAAGVLVAGTPDLEWLLRSSTSTAALTAKNINPVTDTAEGSAAHIPIQAEGGVLFLDRSRERLLFAKFDRGISDKLAFVELTLAARHILEAGAVGITFQRNPNRVVFIHDVLGGLAGISFMSREKVEGWHRHPMPNGKVLDSCTTPAADGRSDETMFIIERTINSQTRRYVEFMTPYFRPLSKTAPTAEGAWFLDSALKYSGTPITNVAAGALNHLVGQTVGVFSGGRDIGDRIVTAGGQLDADIPSSGDVLVGLRIPYLMRSLSFDPPTASGSTKSKKKQANHILLEVVHSAGGMARVNGGEGSEPESLELVDAPESGPMPLYTGRYECGLEAPTALECEIEVFGDDAYPFTLAGYGPDLDVTEG